YCAVGALALVALCAGTRLRNGAVPMAPLAGLLVLNAVPYWLAFSHPTYHFAVIPLIVLIGIPALRSLSESPADFLGSSRAPGRSRSMMLIALGAFVLIQAEW